MLTSHVLRCLPGWLDNLVAFRVRPLRSLVPDQAIREMFALPDHTHVDGLSHIVMTPAGPVGALEHRSDLVLLREGASGPAVPLATSVLDRYSDRLAPFAVDDVDCVGMGEVPPHAPVVLAVNLRDQCAEATATFEHEPDTSRYDLLRAVGVEYLGGVPYAAGFLAHFRNHLPTHILVAGLAGFARTDHCNLFFLYHGRLEPRLEQGLLQARVDRLKAATERAVRKLSGLAERAVDPGLALTCVAPPPADARPFGDLAPLGLVLHALDVARQGEAGEGLSTSCAALEHHLRQQRQELGWPYHRGGLVTATDSALVLQGVRDPEAVGALERFRTGTGAYQAQLCSDVDMPGHMLRTTGNRHWCQPDLGTTCLALALRADADLPLATPDDYLERHFDHRGALFFANPYLVDWALSRTLAHRPVDHPLRRRLVDDILASRNDDGTFGRFDVALSTALAVLSLALLGIGGETLARLRLALVCALHAADAAGPPTPFYSTRCLGRRTGSDARTLPAQITTVRGEIHAVTFYRDDDRMVETAAAVLALLHPGTGPGDERWTDATPVDAHPRYRCRSVIEYLQRYALPPYVSEMAAPS